MQAIDLTGQVFGNLTVISRAENTKQREAQWYCRCTCGNITMARSRRLLTGKKKSCGCAVGIKNGISKPLIERHTLRNRLYKTWSNMHIRCENPKANAYDYYGGRGIRVCQEWSGGEGFDRFREWAISHGYADDLEIDRVNVNGDYEPSNCRWVTRMINACNKRARNESGTTGIYCQKDTGKWKAYIAKKYLGTFKTKEEAIEARKKAEIELGIRTE